MKHEARTQIMIHDLDGVTDAKKIEKGERGEITVSEPRPSKNGCWTARALLPKRCGDKLVQGRSIKIGWASCRVTEKVTIPICYNCLKLGHLGGYCKEQKVEGKRCYKCTSKNHEAANCDQEPKCMECNVDGHIVNSFECPKYRNLMHEKMTRNRNKRTEQEKMTNNE